MNFDEAYDHAIYRWNHREYEFPESTFDTILSEELAS